MVALATDLADAASAVVRRYYRQPVPVDDKVDDSPVTIADREAEQAVRALLAQRRPADGILGEEFGSERLDAEFVWVIDPIDGTKSFIVGRPIFGTLIALTRGGEPILGIIDQPVIADRWIGVAGRDTTLNGVPVRTRACPRMADAILATTAPDLFSEDRLSGYRSVEAAAKYAVYGGDCFNYGMLAAGRLDVVVEDGLKPFDFCALVPIIEGAGGIVTDWAGERMNIASDGGILAAGDPALHAEALALLGG
jgi:inositol-phosphate phosphatase/L-galactose 1-phosphate phosphatase/histidinol-phosphatase